MEKPTWMYRRATDGSVESVVFDSDEIPEGWVDSPAKVPEAQPLAMVGRKPGRPKKAG